ncbi:MAG: hypothetical protein U5O39_16170 [Gammaproteobacteria bacterium]|nr:hypothetical protein [Gammaproteobacteria bacterium]
MKRRYYYDDYDRRPAAFTRPDSRAAWVEYVPALPDASTSRLAASGWRLSLDFSWRRIL